MHTGVAPREEEEMKTHTLLKIALASATILAPIPAKVQTQLVWPNLDRLPPILVESTIFGPVTPSDLAENPLDRYSNALYGASPFNPEAPYNFNLD